MAVTKRYIAGFLLLLTTAPMLVSVLYQIQQKYVQHHMQEQLEKSVLQTLVITGKLNWAKPNKELWINGQLFDVKTLVPQGNGHRATGLFDHQETALKKKAATQADAQGNAMAQNSWLLLQVPAFLSTPADDDPNVFSTTLSTTFALYDTVLAHPSLGVATPPPNRA